MTTWTEEGNVPPLGDPKQPTTSLDRAREIALHCELTDWARGRPGEPGQDPLLCLWCNRWTGKPAKQGPTFCSRDCASEFWANHSWKSAKEAVKKRAGRRCEGVLADGSRCGRKGRATFQVHHLEGARQGGRTRLAACDHHLAGLAYLCPDCHHKDHHGEGGQP